MQQLELFASCADFSHGASYYGVLLIVSFCFFRQLELFASCNKMITQMGVIANAKPKLFSNLRF